jgi:hypothetical protein
MCVKSSGKHALWLYDDVVEFSRGQRQLSHLPSNTFQISHCEVHSRHASVEAAASSDPNRTVNTEGSAE